MIDEALISAQAERVMNEQGEMEEPDFDKALGDLGIDADALRAAAERIVEGSQSTQFMLAITGHSAQERAILHWHQVAMVFCAGFELGVRCERFDFVRRQAEESLPHGIVGILPELSNEELMGLMGHCAQIIHERGR